MFNVSKFFRDERYIKLGGKPLFIIYRPELIKSIRNMMLLWQELAIKSGLPGISFTYQYVNYNHRNSQSGNLFDYGIEYQPAYSMNNDLIHPSINNLLPEPSAFSLNIVPKYSGFSNDVNSSTNEEIPSK